MSKPKPRMVKVKASLLRKAIRLIKKQQATLHEQQRLIDKLYGKRRKRRARSTQPMDAGCGMSGIQMGN